MAEAPSEGGPYRAVYWPCVEGNHIHTQSRGTPVTVRIKLIAAESKKTNYQLRTVIENLVTSKLFLMR